MLNKTTILLFLLALILPGVALSSTPNKTLSPQGTLATGLTGWWKFDDHFRDVTKMVL